MVETTEVCPTALGTVLSVDVSQLICPHSIAPGSSTPQNNPMKIKLYFKTLANMEVACGVEGMMTEVSISLSAIADTQNSFVHQCLQTLTHIPYRTHTQDRQWVYIRNFFKENYLVGILTRLRRSGIGLRQANWPADFEQPISLPFPYFLKFIPLRSTLSIISQTSALPLGFP